jgi:hypothetical protein
LLFLLLTVVNRRLAVANDVGPCHWTKNQTTAASEAEYNDEPYN